MRTRDDTTVRLSAPSWHIGKPLATAAQVRGWTVYWYDRERVFSDASAALGRKDVDALLHEMGRSIGPPWQAKHQQLAEAGRGFPQAELDEGSPYPLAFFGERSTNTSRSSVSLGSPWPATACPPTSKSFSPFESSRRKDSLQSGLSSILTGPHLSQLFDCVDTGFHRQSTEILPVAGFGRCVVGG